MRKVFFLIMMFSFLIFGCSNHEPTSEEVAKFFESILTNDLSGIEKQIKDGMNPNVNNEMEQTALQYSIIIGHFEIADLLISKGADIDYKSLGNNDLLLEAAYRGATSIVEKLLEKGNYDVNEIGKTNWPPLLEAIRLGHYEIVSLLLDKGAEVNFMDKEGWTSLHEAAYNGDISIITLLLENGADQTVKNEIGFMPLHVASLGGYPDAVKLLLSESKSIVNELDIHNRTPLMIAAEQGFIHVVNILLENGADPYLKDNNGQTAAEIAEQWGHIQVAEVIKNN